jgi:hypothetical protein
MPAAFDASSRTWNRSDGPRPRVMIRTASTTSRATPLVAAPSAGASGLVAWYAEGFSDALGDRLRLFDNRGPALELLRFSDAVLAIPGFEAALRTRVELLGAFKHPSFARVRALRVLDDPPAPRLALVSELVAGERVSSMLRTAQAKGVRLDTTSAVWLLRQLLPSLAALHDTGDGVVHGLLDPDRVVVTAGGEVVITEHVFGGVADLMDLAGRTSDIGQAALIAVALLLGRPLRRDEYAANGVTSLDLACATPAADVLRPWLTRALGLGAAPPFASAREAYHALEDLLPGVWGAWPSRLMPALPAGERPRDAAPEIAVAAPPRTWRNWRLPTLEELRRPWPANRMLAAVAVVEAVLIAALLARGSTPAPAPAPVSPAVQAAGLVPAGAAGGSLAGAPAKKAAASAASTAARGWLQIESGVEVRVYANGRLLGPATRRRFILPPGEHSITLVNDRLAYRSTQPVRISAGRTSLVASQVPAR